MEENRKNEIRNNIYQYIKLVPVGKNTILHLIQHFHLSSGCFNSLTLQQLLNDDALSRFIIVNERVYLFNYADGSSSIDPSETVEAKYLAELFYLMLLKKNIRTVSTTLIERKAKDLKQINDPKKIKQVLAFIDNDNRFQVFSDDSVERKYVLKTKSPSLKESLVDERPVSKLDWRSANPTSVSLKKQKVLLMNQDWRSTSGKKHETKNLLDYIHSYLVNLPRDQHDEGTDFQSVISLVEAGVLLYDVKPLKVLLQEDKLHRFILIGKSLFGFSWNGKGSMKGAFIRSFLYYYLISNSTKESRRRIDMNIIPSMVRCYFPLVSSMTELANLVNQSLVQDKRFEIIQKSANSRFIQLKVEAMKGESWLKPGASVTKAAVIGSSSITSNLQAQLSQQQKVILQDPSPLSFQDMLKQLSRTDSHSSSLLNTKPAVVIPMSSVIPKSSKDENSIVVAPGKVGNELRSFGKADVISPLVDNVARKSFSLTAGKVDTVSSGYHGKSFAKLLCPSDFGDDDNFENEAPYDLLLFSPHITFNALVFSGMYSGDSDFGCLLHLLKSLGVPAVLDKRDLGFESKKVFLFLRSPEVLSVLLDHRFADLQGDISLLVTPNQYKHYSRILSTKVSGNDPFGCSVVDEEKPVLHAIRPISFSWTSFANSPSLLLRLLNIDKNNDNNYPFIAFLSEFERTAKEFPPTPAEFIQLLVAIFPEQYHRLIYLMELLIANEPAFFDTEDFWSFEEAVSSLEPGDSANSVFIILLDDPFLSDADISGVFSYTLSRLLSAAQRESSKASNISLVFSGFDCSIPPISSLLKEILSKKHFNVILSQNLSSFRSSPSNDSIENFLSCELFDVVFVDTKLSKKDLKQVSQFLTLESKDPSYHDLVKYNDNRDESGNSSLMYLLNQYACTLFQIPHNPRRLLQREEQFLLLEW
jgi:hypothetical protein